MITMNSIGFSSAVSLWPPSFLMFSEKKLKVTGPDKDRNKKRKSQVNNIKCYIVKCDEVDIAIFTVRQRWCSTRDTYLSKNVLLHSTR